MFRGGGVFSGHGVYYNITTDFNIICLTFQCSKARGLFINTQSPGVTVVNTSIVVGLMIESARD